MKLGQTQIVSAILVVTIALAALSAVVPWSMNMIQKKKDTKSVDDVYNFFLLLDSTIRNIAENGGEESLTLKVPGKLTISPFSLPPGENNTILFVFASKVSNVASIDWIPLNTPNAEESATLGIDPSGVVFGKSSNDGNVITVSYKLWYRELNDTASGRKFRIVLNTSENTMKNTTNGFLRVQRIGSHSDVSQTLTITEINIIV